MRPLSLVPLVLLAAACHKPEERVLISLTPELEPVVTGNNELSWDMLQAVTSLDDANAFFSPFSMVACLSMLYAGANGASEEQLALAMSVPEGGEAGWHENLGALLADLAGEHYRPYTLYSANRVWAQEGFPFEADYVGVLEDAYLSPLNEVDFQGDPEGIRADINDWVADMTHDRIPELFTAGDITGDTRLALVNAIYFLADWATAFDADKTRDLTFTLVDGTERTVPTMQVEGTFEAARMEDGTEVVRLPYETGDLSMILVVPPTEGGIDALVASLSDTLVQDMLDHLMEMEEFSVYMPSFQMGYDLPFKDALMALGVADVFDPVLSDLSGIVDPAVAQLYVGAARHKAFVRVDEQGTEAAAATGIAVDEATAVEDAFTSVHADRPFVYFIRDDLTGTVLFVGRMMDPSLAPLED